MKRPIDGPSTPILPGPALIDRIGALSHPPRVARVKWRWYLDFIDRLNARRFSPWGRRSRRRGVPVS